jgi:hypothetical protein
VALERSGGPTIETEDKIFLMTAIGAANPQPGLRPVVTRFNSFSNSSRPWDFSTTALT